MFAIPPAGHMDTQAAGHMDTQAAGQGTSGPGVIKRLMRTAAQSLATGTPVTAAVKGATLRQLSAIMAFACSKGGFPTVNRHLHVDELAGLGWRDPQPLLDDPAEGEEALIASLATLVGNLSRVRALEQVHLQLGLDSVKVTSAPGREYACICGCACTQHSHAGLFVRPADPHVSALWLEAKGCQLGTMTKVCLRASCLGPYLFSFGVQVS